MRKNNIATKKIFSTFLALVIVLGLSFGMTAYAAPVDNTDNTATTVMTNVNRDKNESQSQNKEITKMPLFNQKDYVNEAYGEYGTVASHGCGVVCLAMVSTYLTNEIYAPEELAEQFGDYNTNKGSLWSLFKDSAKSLNLNLIESDSPNGEWYDWDEVIKALENGQPVICLQGSGIFTSSGHFIVLTGITEDGKILVNDPNGDNWFKNKTMKDGFTNGFTENQIKSGATAYWIYAAKETEEVADGAMEAKLADGAIAFLRSLYTLSYSN